MHYRRFWFVALVVAALSACSSPGVAPQSAGDYAKRGKASYYGAAFQGRTTASGERFNQHAKTAAHRSLPFGTRVKVTNLANEQSVTVTINDRGPFINNRIIDLSRSAFAQIASPDLGVIEVRLQVVR